MKNSRKLLDAVAPATLFLVVFGLRVNPSSAQAVNATWSAGAGNWTTAAHWDCPSAGVHCVPNTVLGTAYNAAINSNGASVTLDNTSGPSYIFVSTLSLGSGTLAISNGASLGAGSMDLIGGTLNVSNGGVAYTRISGWNVEVGTGQLVLIGQPSGAQLSPLVISGLPTSAEVEGDFSALEPEQIFNPLTNPPSPFPNNIIPASELLPTGSFIPIDGNASIGSSGLSSRASVSVDGAGSAWNVAATLTVNATGTLAISNGGSVSVGHPAGGVINSGMVVIDSGSSLSISSGVSGRGFYAYGGGTYTQTAGSTDVNGTLIAPGGVNITGGTLSGSGTIDGSVVNGALIAPGDPTKLTINGDYTQGPNGTLVIDISSLTDFTILDVTGTATLNGAVDFDFLDGYVPQANTAFPFLKAGYVSGDFTSLDVTGINCPHCFFDPFTLTLDIGSTPPTPSSTTPEPASVILFGTALLGVESLVRRKF